MLFNERLADVDLYCAFVKIALTFFFCFVEGSFSLENS